jgi:hypothetical protein
MVDHLLVDRGPTATSRASRTSYMPRSEDIRARQQLDLSHMDEDDTIKFDTAHARYQNDQHTLGPGIKRYKQAFPICMNSTG